MKCWETPAAEGDVTDCDMQRTAIFLSALNLVTVPDTVWMFVSLHSHEQESWNEKRIT